MAPECLRCKHNAVLCCQLCRSLGGGGGAQSLGKRGIALQQLLELVQGCSRGIFGLGGRQIAGGNGDPFSE